MDDSTMSVDGPLDIGRIETPKQFNQLGILGVDGSGSQP